MKILEIRNCETATDSVKIGIVLSGIKSELLATHLALNASKFANYDALRDKLRATASDQRKWVTSAMAAANTTLLLAADGTHKGKQGKDAKGKGRGGKCDKGSKGEDACNAEKKEIRDRRDGNTHCSSLGPMLEA